MKNHKPYELKIKTKSFDFHISQFINYNSLCILKLTQIVLDVKHKAHK